MNWLLVFPIDMFRYLDWWSDQPWGVLVQKPLRVSDRCLASKTRNQNWKLFLLNYFHFLKTQFSFQNFLFLSKCDCTSSAISCNLTLPWISVRDWSRKRQRWREMSQTETERVCVQSAFSTSGVFDVDRVVPTCPAPLCQEITTPSPRSPADCWEKRSLFDVLKRDLQCNLAFHLFPFSFVCDSSRLWRSCRHFHKSEVILSWDVKTKRGRRQ